MGLTSVCFSRGRFYFCQSRLLASEKVVVHSIVFEPDRLEKQQFSVAQSVRELQHKCSCKILDLLDSCRATSWFPVLLQKYVFTVQVASKAILENMKVVGKSLKRVIFSECCLR
jgi:hypothetical protein